jgi:DNA polymerase sigma
MTTKKIVNIKNIKKSSTLFLSPLMKDLLGTANKELLDTYNKIKPLSKEHSSRLIWLKYIEKEIKKLFPKSKLYLFGSFYTGLYTHSSDIDISINIQTNNPNAILRTLKTELIKTKLVYSLVHLCHAKIPILKFRVKKFGFKFDISINNEGGVSAGNYVYEIVRNNEHIKIFAILFKHFITSRRLGDASVGGLNSYSQFLMIYNYFLVHPLINTLCIETNLSILFFDFVQFYGYTFKYKCVQIDCKNLIYKPNPNKRLSIVDPTDSSIDVGACCKNMDLVVDSLQNFYRTILYHHENNSVDRIFKEMFYISQNESLQRKYVIKHDVIKPKKMKSKRTSLRDINLCKDIKIDIDESTGKSSIIGFKDDKNKLKGITDSCTKKGRDTLVYDKFVTDLRSESGLIENDKVKKKVKNEIKKKVKNEIKNKVKNKVKKKVKKKVKNEIKNKVKNEIKNIEVDNNDIKTAKQKRKNKDNEDKDNKKPK